MATLMVWLPIYCAAQESNPAPTCPVGYECHVKGAGHWFTVDELAQVDRRLAENANTIALLELKKVKRFGWTVGMTLAVGPTLNQGVPGVAALAGVGITYGWRF